MTLSNGDSGGAFSPQAVVTSGGRVYVAWVDGYDIRFARLGALSGSCGGRGGLEPELFQTLWDGHANGQASAVAMAANESGVYVAWRACQGDCLNGSEIRFSRSTDGGGSFLPKNEPLSQNASTMSDPSVAADSAGGVFVVWEENASGASAPAVRIAQSTDRGMNFSPTGTVFAAAFGFLYQPSVASTGSAVHVVWNDLGSQRILHKKFAPGDDPGGSFSPLTNPFATGPMNPRIAAHGSQVTAAWTEFSETGIGIIKARTMTDGQTFGDEGQVPSSGNSVLGLALSVGGAGRFAAWPELKLDFSGVLLGYAVGNTVGRLPSGSTETSPWAPSVGQDGSNLLVATWQELGKDSDGQDVWQVKLAHTGGSGSSTPMQATVWVRRKAVGVKIEAQEASDADDEAYPPKGPRVNVYIEFPKGSDGSAPKILATDIDPDTLRLNGQPRVPGRPHLGDKNHNGIKDLKVKFPKSAFAVDGLTAGKHEGYFTVEGKTRDGRCFSGTGTVKLKVKVKAKR